MVDRDGLFPAAGFKIDQPINWHTSPHHQRPVMDRTSVPGTTIYTMIKEQRYDEAVQILHYQLQVFPRSRAALSLIAYCQYYLQDFQVIPRPTARRPPHRLSLPSGAGERTSCPSLAAHGFGAVKPWRAVSDLLFEDHDRARAFLPQAAAQSYEQLVKLHPYVVEYRIYYSQVWARPLGSSLPPIPTPPEAHADRALVDLAGATHVVRDTLSRH